MIPDHHRRSDLQRPVHDSRFNDQTTHAGVPSCRPPTNNWPRYKQYLCICPSIGLSLDISRMNFDESFLQKMAPTMEKAFAQNEKDYGRVDGPNGNGVFYDPGDKGRGLQLQFTVEDPNMLTMPWSATVTYRKAGSGWQEQVCAENQTEYYANKDTQIPVAARADF